MRKLKEITLGARFLLLAALLAVVVFIESGVVITGSTIIADQAAHLGKNEIPVLNQAHRLKLAMVQVQQWLTDISATRGRDGLNDGFDEAEKNAREFRLIIDELKMLDSENAQRYKAMMPTFNSYYQAGKKMARAYIDEGPDGGNKMMAQFDEAAAKMAEEVDSFLAGAIALTTASIERQQELAASTRLSVTIGSLIILLGIGLVYLIMSRALAHLPRLVAEMQRVAEGDLTSTFEVTRQDEIGHLMQGLHSMRNRLLEMISRITGTTAELSSAMEEMSSMTVQTGANIERQQSETAQVATAMTELTATVHEVARNITDSAHAAKDAHTETTKSGQVVEAAVGAMQHLSTQIDSATDAINQLAQDSNKISTVLDVIKSVAEQTNLLALNAAIEAARAGEQGRGFAVVADEVRTLASRTQQSTEEINQMIEQLQSGSNRAVQMMSQSREEARSAVEQASTAGVSLGVITDAVGRINDMSTQIASAAEEQSAVSEEINRSIVQINDMANQNAAGAEQTAMANQGVLRIVTQLQNLVDQFRV